jgi:NADPH2:quinone reductase
MRAVVCPELGTEDVLRVEEGPTLPCAADEIRVQVRAAAVNFPDCLMIRGEYQVRKEPPFVPGHECAGDVVAVGTSVTEFHVGDRVLVLGGTGGFATEVVTKATGDRVHRIPDGMSFEHAAGFTLTYGTALHALKRRVATGPDDTVLVLGAAGGCGSAAVQVAKALGATVIAAAGGPEKCALAAALGADHAIDYLAEKISPAVLSRTAGRGVDVVFDPVGGEDIRDTLRAMAWNGRYAVIGFAGGTIPTVRLNQLILKSISFVGVAYGASVLVEPQVTRADMVTLFEWYENGLVTPHIGHRLPLDSAAEAMRIVFDRKARGKVVLEMT